MQPFTVIGHYRDTKKVQAYHAKGATKEEALSNLEAHLQFGRPFTVTSILPGYQFDRPAGVKELVHLCNEIPGQRAWLRARAVQ